MSLWWMKGRERESERERKGRSSMLKTPLTPPASRFSLTLPNSSLFLHSPILHMTPEVSRCAEIHLQPAAAQGPDDITGLASALTGCLIQSSHLVESERWESQSTLHPEPSMQPDSQRHGTYTTQRCRVTAEDALMHCSSSFQQDRHKQKTILQDGRSEKSRLDSVNNSSFP